MQAASRESLAAVTDRFDELAAGSDKETLDTLGVELSSVAQLLSNELTLRKHLADPSADSRAKTQLLESLFGSKVSDTTMQVLRAIVSQRWSRGADLLDAIEHFARRAVLFSAERAGVVDSVEDELFRFGRVVGASGQLSTLLGDDRTDPDRRVKLLDDLVGGKVQPQTKALLEQYVRAPRGHRADEAINELAELTAARKGESVAQVTAAAPLTEQQQTRLAQVLSSIYHRTISLQVQVDPQVVGGLLIKVGDEVIDGSLASKLARASQNLPN